MALARPPLQTVSGLVTDVVDRGDVTELAIRSSDGDVVRIEVPGGRDERAADQLAAGYRRLVWQRIDVGGARTECRIRGVRHRLPGEQPISVGAALALAGRGLATIVRVEGG